MHINTPIDRYLGEVEFESNNKPGEFERWSIAGEVVKTCYVATHTFMGQQITGYDIAETTIARGLVIE